MESITGKIVEKTIMNERRSSTFSIASSAMLTQAEKISRASLIELLVTDASHSLYRGFSPRANESDSAGSEPLLTLRRADLKGSERVYSLRHK